MFAFLLWSQIAFASSVRVVSLHPAITENLFALGLGSQIVGTTSYSDYPEDAKKIPRIGDHNFSIEKIIALKPTHIISITDRFGVSKDLAQKLNIELLKIPLETLEDYLPAMTVLSKKFSVSPDRAISDWNEQWKLSRLVKVDKRVSVVVQLSPLIAVGRNTFLNSLIERCGAINAINVSGYPLLNRESLVRANPDEVIFLLLETGASSEVKLIKNLLRKAKFLNFDPNAISKITPRLPKEAKKFCEAMQ